MAESGATRHLALGEVQPQARSKSQAARPSAVGVAAGGPLEAQDHGGHTERGQEWVPHAGGSRDRGLACLGPKGEALGRLLRQPGPAAAFWKLLCPSARAAASWGASALPSHLFHSAPSSPPPVHFSPIFISFLLWSISGAALTGPRNKQLQLGGGCFMGDHVFLPLECPGEFGCAKKKRTSGQKTLLSLSHG